MHLKHGRCNGGNSDGTQMTTATGTYPYRAVIETLPSYGDDAKNISAITIHILSFWSNHIYIHLLCPNQTSLHLPITLTGSKPNNFLCSAFFFFYISTWSCSFSGISYFSVSSAFISQLLLPYIITQDRLYAFYQEFFCFVLFKNKARWKLLVVKIDHC